MSQNPNQTQNQKRNPVTELGPCDCSGTDFVRADTGRPANLDPGPDQDPGPPITFRCRACGKLVGDLTISPPGQQDQN